MASSPLRKLLWVWGRGQASPLYPWVQVGPGTYGLQGQSKALHHPWGLQGVMNLTYLDCEVQGWKHSYAFSLTMGGILHRVSYLPELRSRHKDPCSSKSNNGRYSCLPNTLGNFSQGFLFAGLERSFQGLRKLTFLPLVGGKLRVREIFFKLFSTRITNTLEPHHFIIQNKVLIHEIDFLY